MSKLHPIVVKDRIYIPCEYVDEDILEAKFQPSYYQEERCSVCDYREERHTDVCDDCPGFLGRFKLYNEKKFKGQDYYGIGIGNKKSFKKLLTIDETPEILDFRVAPKFKFPIEFTGELRDYQTPAIEQLLKKRYGILKAPPRSGKTVMLTKIACDLGLKVLIIANQYDYLQQFYETLCGSTTQPALTNIPDIEASENVKLCGIVKKFEDFFTYDIALSTYQTFISEKGKSRLAKVKKQFGVIMIDECDLVPATAYAKVINTFYAKHRIGCTGTIERKDNKHHINSHILGPVTAEAKVETLTPSVEFVETGITIEGEYKILAYAYKALANAKGRDELIIEWLMHDLAAGHSIVVPVATVKQCVDLVAKINKRYGKDIAVAFTAATTKTKEKRTDIILKARAKKFRVVVGIRKMIQRGINVPAWSCLYHITPISNPPNYHQETSRIRTPVEGKNAPLVRFFLDDFGFSKGCLRTCMFREGLVHHKFKISKQNWDIVKRYLSKSKYFEPNKMFPDKAVITKQRKRLTF